MAKDHRTFPRIRGTSAQIQAWARALRRRATPAEQKLWERLRNRRLKGLKFRRQHPLGPYIADFYCAAHRLVVELDGGIHEQQREEDARRTAYFEAYGYKVLRFRNEEVEEDIEGVLRRIAEACGARASPLPQISLSYPYLLIGGGQHVQT